MVLVRWKIKFWPTASALSATFWTNNIVWKKKSLTQTERQIEHDNYFKIWQSNLKIRRTFFYIDKWLALTQINNSPNKVPFHIYYVIKDLLILLTFSFIFLFTTLNYGYNLIDAENFIPANPLVTPIHIQPEWYFLFTYAILRSIPNKLGGVVLIASAFLVLFLFGINRKNHFFRGFQFSPISRFIFWSLVSVFLLLTWLGSCPAESPFVEVSLACTLLYFFLFGLLLFIANMHYWFFRK